MIELRQTKVYNRWSYGLRDWQAKVRINVRIQRLFLTNPGDVRAGGEGISEPRINYGPGYRVYFIRQERSITILLAAGDKDCGQLISPSPWNWLGICRRTIKAKTETFPWSLLDVLETWGDMIVHLNAALEQNELELIAIVLADIAQAVGESQMASDVEFSRECLEKLAH